MRIYFKLKTGITFAVEDCSDDDFLYLAESMDTDKSIMFDGFITAVENVEEIYTEEFVKKQRDRVNQKSKESEEEAEDESLQDAITSRLKEYLNALQGMDKKSCSDKCSCK